MEENQNKPILSAEYDDDDDSSSEEEDEELFDNRYSVLVSKVDWRVKGNLLRGKDFSVSENGNCPRCQSNVIVFVILDELFPMGDMPEILYNLLAKGKAVLWSSQDKQSCKKSPTFMCRGFCPPDPLGAGFNINWDTVNLTKLLKDLLKLNIAKAQKKLQESEKEENEGEDEDVNEKDIIKAMLAKEEEKQDTGKPVNGDPLKGETTTASLTATVETTPTTSSGTTTVYPVSKDGLCPHCGSAAVRYIILIKDTTKDVTLPPTLERLLKMGKAFKMAKGANNPPSFQCCSCTYGFNLDWSKTNLKKVFNLENQTTTPSSSNTSATAPLSTPVSSTTYSYEKSTATSYPASSYQNLYAYSQPPTMSYSGPAPYGYPSSAPLIAPQPVTNMIPPGGIISSPYGAPMPYHGAPPQPYQGMPSQPFGTNPPAPPGALIGPPQTFAGSPLNQFGPIPPPGSMPHSFQPQMGGAPMYSMQPTMNIVGGNVQGNVPGLMPFNSPSPGVVTGTGPMFGLGPGPQPFFGPGPAPMPGPGPMQAPVPMPVPGPMQGPGPFPGNIHGPPNFSGNIQGSPRLRVPKTVQQGRHKNWKGNWKGQHGNIANKGQSSNMDGVMPGSSGGEEESNEKLYDPEAATRFEELLNKIDDQEDDPGYHEDEKPPGEDTQVEFEVSALTPDEKPTKDAKNISKPVPNVEAVQATTETATIARKSEVVQQNVLDGNKENLTILEVDLKPVKVSNVESVPDNSSQQNNSQTEAMQQDVVISKTNPTNIAAEPEPVKVSDVEHVTDNSSQQNNSQTEAMQQDVVVSETNPTNIAAEPEPVKVSDVKSVPDYSGQLNNNHPEAMEQNVISVGVTNLNNLAAESAKPVEISNVKSERDNSSQENNSQASMTSAVKSERLEMSPTVPKAGRGRKRQATGGRKKTTRNTKAKTMVENMAASDVSVGDNNVTDGLTEAVGGESKVKVENEPPENSTNTDESIEVGVPVETQPKRMTRARSQRQKK